MQAFDIVVAGAGVAGLSAAAEAARAGWRVAVVEHQGAGGQIMSVDRIRNFPGHEDGIAGYDLGPLLQEEAEDAGAGFVFGTVRTLASRPDGLLVSLDDEDLLAGAVILATGSARRPLAVPGAQRLEGHGVSHCASCDGPLYRGREVCVVGGGDSALDEALVLARHAERVWLVHRGASLDGQPALQREAQASGKIRLLLRTEVAAVLGDGVVSGVRLRTLHDGGERELAVDGVFAYIGLVPNSRFDGTALKTDDHGRLLTDAALQTSTPGIFAAGDLRAGCVAMLADCAEDGRAAARAAGGYLGRARARAG